MDICKRLLAGLAVLALGVAPVVAERRFEKKADATNVVTGQVVKVYSKDSKLGIDGVFTSYLIEIKVEAIEKGAGDQGRRTALRALLATDEALLHAGRGTQRSQVHPEGRGEGARILEPPGGRRLRGQLPRWSGSARQASSPAQF